MSQKTALFLIFSLVILSSCSKGSSLNLRTPDAVKETDTDNDNSYYVSPGDGSNGGTGPDPLAISAWHLRNVGQTTFSNPDCSATSCTTYGSTVIGEDSGLRDSHLLYNTGAGVRVAISDNGTDIMHEDLYFNIDQSSMRNYTSDDPDQWLGNPLPNNDKAEISAHGTAVVGVIGALKNNLRGSYGVAPDATLIPFKYVGTSGGSDKEIDQADGLIDIFNYSYGRSSCTYHYMNPSYIDQLRYGVSHLRGGLGALYVKAAGNEYVSYSSECAAGSDDYYLGNANFEEDNSYPYLIVTAAMNASGKSATYSSPGSSIWITAPAGEFGDDAPAILSTDLMGCSNGFSRGSAIENEFESGKNALNSNCNYTSTMNGTSAATPMVSGAIALILAERPRLSWRDVKDILARSARQIDSSNSGSSYPLTDSRFPNLPGHKYQMGWITNAAGLKYHNWYGFGALDIQEALRLARSRTSTLPALIETLSGSDWRYVKNMNTTIPDEDKNGVSDTISVSQNLSIEAIQIRVSVDHTRSSDLGIELTSPAGTKSQLMLINSNIVDRKLDDVILLSNAFYGEESAGNWTIKVLDGRSGESGSLKRWGVHVFGHSLSAAIIPLSNEPILSEGQISKGAKSLVTDSSPKISAISFSKQAESKNEKNTSSQDKKKLKDPKGNNSRGISSFTQKFEIETKKESGKGDDAIASLDTLCLAQVGSELQLQWGSLSLGLLRGATDVTVFAYDQLNRRIIIAQNGADDGLSKLNIYDSELKLIDETFLEDVNWDGLLSAGIFSGTEVMILTKDSLSTLELSEFKISNRVKIDGLTKLALSPRGARAYDQQDELGFDATGLILSRKKSSQHFKQTWPFWSETNHKKICLGASMGGSDE